MGVIEPPRTPIIPHPHNHTHGTWLVMSRGPHGRHKRTPPRAPPSLPNGYDPRASLPFAGDDPTDAYAAGSVGRAGRHSPSPMHGSSGSKPRRVPGLRPSSSGSALVRGIAWSSVGRCVCVDGWGGVLRHALHAPVTLHCLTHGTAGQAEAGVCYALPCLPQPPPAHTRLTDVCLMRVPGCPCPCVYLAVHVYTCACCARMRTYLWLRRGREGGRKRSRRRSSGAR